MPILKARVSAKASFGLWQLAQLTEESKESIFSKKSFLPSETFEYMVDGSCLKEKLTRAMKTERNMVINKGLITVNLFLSVLLFMMMT